VVLDVVRAKPTEEADGRRGGIELGNLVLVDGLPVAGGSGIDWSRLENGGGNAVTERPVDDVSVAGNPTDVSHASKAIVIVDVEDVFDGKSSAEEVSTRGVNDALWFTRRTGSLIGMQKSGYD
jgi:hypothetical protein